MMLVNPDRNNRTGSSESAPGGVSEEIEDFLTELAADNAAYYSGLPSDEKTYWPHEMSGAAAIAALSIRWFNEYASSITLARLVEKVQPFHLKMLTARQVGDEAKHATVCAARIKALGGDVRDYAPPPEQLRFYEVLDGYPHAEQFFAAMQFTTEAQGVVRNEQALERFDDDTARVFREAINPDEPFHVQLGWTALRTLCTSSAARERARSACHEGRELHHAMTIAYRKLMRERQLL